MEASHSPSLLRNVRGGPRANKALDRNKATFPCRPPHSFSLRVPACLPHSFPLLQVGSPAGTGLPLTPVCHPLLAQSPPTPLANPSASAPTLETGDPASDPTDSRPPVRGSGWISPFLADHSADPPIRTAGQPGLRLPGWPSRPDAGPRWPGPPLCPARPRRLPPPNHLRRCRPHVTPPSRAAAPGTIPAAYWLLPRQPGAPPLSTGPARTRLHLCAGQSGSRVARQITDRRVGVNPWSHLRSPVGEVTSRVPRDSLVEMSDLYKVKRALRQKQE